MAGRAQKTAGSPVRPQKQHQQQQQQQDRVLQASFLIPAYQKALPQALLHDLPDDHRLRKIEATCNCKITWGRLPDQLAERYRLLQMAFDPGRRGNYLGALNLLRQYFLGHMAMMPFQQTLLRPDGRQVTRKFPTSVDDCRLLMPRRFDRFGRDADGVVTDLAKAAAVATAAKDSECRHLAEETLDSCLRCLALHAAFVESEAAATDEATVKRAEAAGASAAHLISGVETLTQCEISRACVCALVEAAEATRLLARLHSSSQPPPLPSPPPPPQLQSSVSPSRRRIDFQLSTSSSAVAKKRPNTRMAEEIAATRYRYGEKKQLQQCQLKHRTVTATTTAQQANNHHKPYADGAKRAQYQPLHQPNHAPNLYQQHRAQQKHQFKKQAQNPEESCDTTLADVEAITFAESEYVNAATAAKTSPSPAAVGLQTTTKALTKLPATKSNLPETLLLCGLQPSAALALAALDRSDRRLKAVERRTGCRLELRERRCFTMATHETDATPAGIDMPQQVSYALQVVPLRPDSRPRGCANMLRTLLRRLDPSGRYFFCVVSASELPTPFVSSASKQQRSPVISRQRYQPSTTTPVRSKSAARVFRSRSTARAELEQASRQPQQQEQHQQQQFQHQRYRWQSQPPIQCGPSTALPSAIAACARSLINRCAIDCLLGIVTSSTAVVNAQATPAFQRSLERDREAVLSDTLLCIFRSLTATEDDARLIDEAIDEADDDDILVDDCGDEHDDDLCASTTGSFVYVRKAIQRTLVICADERRLDCLLGAFAACLPPQMEQRQQEPPISSTLSPFSTTTQRVRRRLARQTLVCWERLCNEVMTTSRGGASVLLAGVAFEVACEAAESELASERQQLQQQHRHQKRRSRRASLDIRKDQQHQLLGKMEETLHSLAGRLIAEQVWSACMKAQLMQRLRLRAS